MAYIWENICLKVTSSYKDGGKYTLESHKELQKDRENVKINTADIKNVTFDLVKSVNDIEQV